MVKVLFIDGSEKHINGKVHFFEHEIAALCRYDIQLEGYGDNDYDKIKFIYDEDSTWGVKYNDSSFGFYDETEYKQAYIRALLELEESK